MMSSTIKTAKILLVEDDPLIRRLVAQTLVRAEFEVVEAADGEEAAERLEAESPDVVVSDVQMPRMSGTELLQHIRARFGWLPVILMTGVIDGAVRVAAFRWGATALFQKPVSRKDLILAVRTAQYKTPPWDCEFVPATASQACAGV